MRLRVLFENNRKWAESIRSATPDFFARLCGQQNPKYLWIGCSDSRVPASTIVGLVDDWIRPIMDVRDEHHLDLEVIEDEDSRLDRLCELSVSVGSRDEIARLGTAGALIPSCQAC